VVVGREKAEADVIKERVSADEAVVSAQAAEVTVIATDAQKDLDLAMPALSNAVKALNSLTKGDITEVKSFAKPPPAVQTVMEGVCIMLGQKPDWDTAKKVVLADSNFLDKLKNYDKVWVKMDTKSDFVLSPQRSRSALCVCDDLTLRLVFLLLFLPFFGLPFCRTTFHQRF
jgi:hypothetical protein